MGEQPERCNVSKSVSEHRSREDRRKRIREEVRSQVQDTLRSRGLVEPRTLLRWCEAAVLRNGGRKLSSTEQEAATQIVAMRVIREHGAHPARDRVGVNYLNGIARSALSEDSADARSVRDCAAEYRTAKQRQQDTGPMIVALPDETDVEAGSSVSLRALARPGEAVPVLTRGTIPLAHAVAREVGRRIMLPGVAREQLQSVIVLAGVAADGSRPGKSLAVVARSLGCSPRTVSNRADRGRAILAGFHPAEVRALVREAAAVSPWLSRDPRADGRPMIEPEQREALDAAAWLVGEARTRGFRELRRNGARTVPGGRVALSVQPIRWATMRQWQPAPRPGHSDVGCSEVNLCGACCAKRDRKRAEADRDWRAFIAARGTDRDAPMPDRMAAAVFQTLLGAALDDRASAGSISRATLLLRVLYGAGEQPA